MIVADTTVAPPAAGSSEGAALIVSVTADVDGLAGELLQAPAPSIREAAASAHP
jgi:hypothetical protein